MCKLLTLIPANAGKGEYAMEMYSEGLVDMQEIFGADPLTEGIKAKLGELVKLLLDTELEENIKAVRYSRSQERSGHRNGVKSRRIYGSFGAVDIKVPRGRIKDAEGEEGEWQSRILPRYQRRTTQMDATLVSLYFSGTNLGRIERALKPLMADAPITKSVVSRLVKRLAKHLEEWKKRDLSKTRYVYIYLDAKNLKVRVLNRVQIAPVLIALGVREDGVKEVLAIEAQLAEKESAWLEVVEDLSRRGLKKPELAIIDGNKGLRNALAQVWPGILVQRCTVHKLRNLEQHTPAGVYDEVKSDYQQIVEAEDLKTAQQNHKAFVTKWKDKLPKVVASLEEAQEEILTFYRFPKEQWKSIKTTNPIERLNLEFKRRVKTQCSLPSDESAVLLLFGLIISGQIRFHKIQGWEKMKEVTERKPLKECA